MEMRKINMNSGMLSELECPVCLEYMQPPIIFCINGHSVCPGCKPMLRSCPICREQFLNIRNIALEKMSLQIEHPCSYRRSGCLARVSLDNRKDHEDKCLFHRHSCPLSKIPAVRCQWEGPLQKLKVHVIEEHKEWTHDYKGSFMTGLVDIKPFRRYCYIIFALDQIFYRYFSVKDGNLYGVLMYVGPKENSENYKYKVTFKNNTECISITHTARSVSEDLDEIREAGKCVKLHFDVVKNFVNTKNNLKFQMEIFQAVELCF